MSNKKYKLNAELRHLMRSPTDIPDVRGNFITESHYVGAIAAGYLLRRNVRLERQGDSSVTPIRLSNAVIPELARHSPSAAMMRDIVNSSLQPQLTTAPNFSERACGIYEGACRYAEVQFAKLILGMRSNDDQAVRGGRVIAHGDRALLLQKTHGEKTALALSRVAIESVEYPAGSLLALHVARDLQPEQNKYHTEIDSSQVQVVPAQEVVGMSFLRPSLLAFEPSDRNNYLRNLGTACAGYVGTADFLATASLQTATNAARTYIK